MKTETEMLAKAMEIVDNNPNACVGFFYPTDLKAKWGAMTLRDKLMPDADGVFYTQTMTYLAQNRSKLFVMAIDKS